jgi:hypothetical protein
VSNDGQIRNDKTGKIKAKNKDSKGYYSESLYKDGKAVTKKVHRLVAEAFIPNPDSKPCVNHIDGNKLNNSVDNLEWVTHSENMRHAFDTGLAKPHSVGGMRGKKNPNGGRKGKPILCITNNIEYPNVAAASRDLGIPDSSIFDCLYGKARTARGFVFEFL